LKVLLEQVRTLNLNVFNAFPSKNSEYL